MIKDDIKHYDRIMIVVLIFYLAVTGITIFVLNHIAQETGADIEKVTDAYESNWVNKIFLNMKQFGFILQFILIPGLGFTIYHHYRKKVLKKKIDIESFGFYVLFLFFTLLMDVVNDIAVLLGRIL